MHGYLNAITIIFQCLGLSFSTLEEANTLAQRHLLRAGERWNAQPDKELYPLIKKYETVIREQLKNLSMIDAHLPQSHHYEYALILGSLKEDMVHRVSFFKDLCDQGYTFDHCVLLGSQRPLENHEKVDIPSSVSTESSLLEFLWNSYFGEKKYTIINAPLIKNNDGTTKRPTTDDTLVAFANRFSDKKGSCLVVGESPYLARQLLTAQRILGSCGFTLDGAAASIALKNNDIVMLMDELARFIYELYKKSMR